MARVRALAWLYTGPVGHFYGTVADLMGYWVRWALRLPPPTR